MKRGNTAQVVLLPGGEIGDAVLRLVEQWTLVGLLDPVYWVPASFVIENSLGPAQVSAIVMGRTSDGQLERRKVGLLATMGGDRLEEVVVSSVRWLAPGQTDRNEVSVASERLLEAISQSVPTGFAHGGAALSDTSVRSINMVLAATAVTSDEVRSLLSNRWQENIVVSPESRQRPGAADSFNDAEAVESWAGFIASSVASLAGLWAGMTSTPIQKVASYGMVSDIPQVRVARTFTRAVVSSGYTLRLARAVAGRLADTSSLLADPLITSRRTDIHPIDGVEADAEIARALEYLKRAESGRLSYQGLLSPEQLTPRSVGIRAFGDFLQFSVDKVVAIPTWTITWFVDRISRNTQERLYGDGSGVVVDLRDEVGLRKSDRDLLEIAEQLGVMRAQLQSKINAPQPTVHRVNVPSLWEKVRSVIFTLADGGSANQEFEGLRISGSRAVVAELGLVVPLPGKRWKLPRKVTQYLTGDEETEVSASWAGVQHAEALFKHLDESAVVAEQRVNELRDSQPHRLAQCFAAEGARVGALHQLQDDSSWLRIAEAERQIFSNIGEGRSLPVDGKAEAMSEEERVIDEPVIEALTEMNNRAVSALLRAESQVKARHNRYHDLAGMVDEARGNRDELVKARDSLDSWLDERRRSLSIQLISHVDSELRRIKKDEVSIREFGREQEGDFAGAARRLRSEFVRRMLVALIFSVVITLVVLVVALLLSQARISMPVVELSAWRYVVLFAVVFLLGTIGSLSRYFRGFNRMKNSLDVALSWGRNALESIDRIRADQARLGELRPQLAERLDFYGGILQSPWGLPDSDDLAEDLQSLADGLPANLRVAEVKGRGGVSDNGEVSDKGEDVFKRLVQKFTAEHFTIGLRREAANRLLAEAAKSHGLDSKHINFEFLDRDDIQKGLRDVLKGYASQREVLERVGSERVGQIAESIQRGLSPLNDHRPLVSIINNDHLDDPGLGSADRRQQSWDEFISEILEHPSALSMLAFSDKGAAAGEQHNFKSIASGPLRVRMLASQHVSWAEIQSEAITGTEVVSRIDITDPIDASKVSLFCDVADSDASWDDNEPPEPGVT